MLTYRPILAEMLTQKNWPSLVYKTALNSEKHGWKQTERKRIQTTDNVLKFSISSDTTVNTQDF
jgi:hypothetical protein